MIKSIDVIKHKIIREISQPIIIIIVESNNYFQHKTRTHGKY